MPYTIIVGDDNSLYGSNKEKIIQKEKLFNKLWFLVAPDYKGYDMTECTVTLRYLLPISKEFAIETLVLSEERYDEYLKYELPIDTNLTKECGDVELSLTFILLETDSDGNIIQRVRKTTNHTLHITPIPNWDAVIPDANLCELDQRILKMEAQIKALEGVANTYNQNQVDNLVYEYDSDALQLMAGDKEVGGKVFVRDMIDDSMLDEDYTCNGRIVEF